MRKRQVVVGLGLGLVASMGLAPGIAQADGPTQTPKDPAQRFIVQYETGSAPAKAIDASRTGVNPVEAMPATDQAALDKSAAQVGADVTASTAIADDAVVITLDKKLSAKESTEFVKKLEADPAVEFVEPDLRMTTTADPNDPSWSRQWEMLSAPDGIGVTGAWDRTEGRGVVVAVIDSGITVHPDLDANVLPGYDFISNAWTARDGDGRDANPADEGDWVLAGECGNGRPLRAQASSWHGTHVSGTIAAVKDNRTGIAGVAPMAKVLPARALGRCGGMSSDITAALTGATGGAVPGVPANANPAKVVNMSLGGYSRSCPASYQRAIDQAVARGATVVVAAGNETDNAADYTPANCNNVVVVGATGVGGQSGALLQLRTQHHPHGARR